MNIGTTIIKIRKEKQMTQEEFAKLFHVTRQTVSNWENEKSYPDIKTLVEISDKFDISLDKIIKEDMKMVKKIDNYRNYKKVFIILIVSILTIGIFVGIYMGICMNQHKRMYDKLIETGFTDEHEDFDRYQGLYALTENNVDYMVVPKSLGKYELDNENFYLFARKGNNDITIIVDRNRKIKLALYLNGGNVEIDEKGNIIEKSKNFSDEQREEAEDLLKNRKDEIMPIVDKALELWDTIND